MKVRHIVSAANFDRQFISEIFNSATKVKKSPNDYKEKLTGKIMATLFYEPSTRTRLSFESAMLRLGGDVISTENASEFSSAAKGETLEDTIRVVNKYSDVIVLRHFTEGASKIASSYSDVPIINAGDGKGEHPTQALLDLFTIFSKFSTNKSGKQQLTVSMIGDLKNGRTIHSLAQLFSLYDNFKLIFVSPRVLAIPQSLRSSLIQKNVKFEETEDLNSALKSSDVIYQTRIQKERFKSNRSGESEYIKYLGRYIIDKKTLKIAKDSSIIMHPLPRVNEIKPEVDSDKRAVYFEQVENGIYVRMALLLYLFDKAY